jgi:uncharacterized protein (TIGR00266 family)
MEYQILYPDAFPILQVKMQKGESVKAESDAMVSMSSTIDVDGKLEGGLLGGLGRMLSGEKFFFQTLTANRGAGEALLAPSIPGSIVDVELDGSYGLCVQKDGFLAGTENIVVSTKAQNLMQGIFSGEGFFILKISGRGTVFVNSYGAIHAINIPEGQDAIIDNSHLVAWPDYMQYKIEKASSGWISSFTSGEALVCRFQGPGTVLIQTRNPKGFGSWIQQFIPKPSR